MNSGIQLLLTQKELRFFSQIPNKILAHCQTDFGPEHLSLKVPNIKFDFDVSVRQCLLSTDTLKSNLPLNTHLHAIIRSHNFRF